MLATTKTRYYMTEKPNIILFFPDQWRFDALSAFGHPVAETPFLDQLAMNGVTFTAAYTPAPTCIAARASLATGCTPYHCGRVGYRDFIPWGYPQTFMHLLRDGGYETMCAGKTHFYPARARLGFEELALYETEWQDPGNPSDYHRFLERETGGRVKDTATTHDSNSYLAVPWTAGEELHPNSWTIAVAIEMLEKRDPLRPFFLQLSPHRPHPPIDPPISWFERYTDVPLPPVPIGDWADENDIPITTIAPGKGRIPERLLDRSRRAYFAQIAHLDDQFGRLLRFLKGTQLSRNTWIIFASDHGELLGDHHMFRKTNIFEGSAHIPLFVMPPEEEDFDARGKRCSAPVSLTDLAPTILDIAGVQIPESMDGKSLFANVMEPERAFPPHEFIHIEHAPCHQGVTDGKEKFIWNSQEDKRYFFDLSKDPMELHNLVDLPEYEARVTFWEQRLIGILSEWGDFPLVRDGRLAAGAIFDAVRPEILEKTYEPV